MTYVDLSPLQVHIVRACYVGRGAVVVEPETVLSSIELGLYVAYPVTFKVCWVFVPLKDGLDPVKLLVYRKRFPVLL